MKKKTKKTILYTLAAVIVLWMLSNIFWENKSNSVIKSIRASGYPATCEDMEKYYGDIPYDPNTAEVYMEAFGCLDVNDTNGVPLFSQIDIIDMSLEKTEKFLETNKKASELLYRGAEISNCKFPLEFTDGYSMLLPSIGQVRDSAKLLTLESIYYAKMGDVDRSYKSLMAAWELSQAVKHEPVLISYLVKNACQSLVLTNLEQVMNDVDFTDAQYIDIIKAISLSKDNQLVMGFVGERCFFSEILFASGQSIAELSGGQGMVWGVRATKLFALDDINYVRMVSFSDRYIEAAKLPHYERDVDGIDEELQEMSFIYLYVKMYMPALHRILEIDARHEAIKEVAKVGLRMKRCNMSDNIISPTAKTIDPFNGEELKYTETETEFIIYSVGQDGIDNGGVRENEKGDKYKDGTDIVFEIKK